MAAKKRGRHAKRGGRTTPKGTRPLTLVHGAGSPPREEREPGLIEMVADALRQSHPLDLLGLVSSMLWLASPTAPNRPADLPTLELLVDTWADIDRRETTALLRAVCVLGQTAELREAASAAAARRAHRLPAWLDGLAEARVTRVVEVGHVLGDGEAVLLDVDVPGSTGITLDIYVDHNIGTVVKDAFVAPQPLDAVLERMADLLQEPGTFTTDLTLADACARIVDALVVPLHNDSRHADDERTWPRSRPLVDWILRTLPPGGTGYVHRAWTEAELAELVASFFSSPWGRALRDRRRRRMLEQVLEVASEGDDPTRWSPVRVEVLMAEGLLEEVEPEPDVLALVPDLLRAFIGYCHSERGVPEDLTDETMAAVDRWLPVIERAIDALEDLYDAEDPMWSWSAELLSELAAATGSVAALRDLEVQSLPDEPFDWRAVPPEAVAAVEPVVELADDICERLFDVELRTAARRLIARLAAADASLFTRRSRLECTVAAIVWAVATANDAFTTHGLLVKELVADLGVSGTPSQRADTFLRVLPGAQRTYEGVGLGSVDLLTSTGRAHLVARRDRGLQALARQVLLGPDAWARGAPDEVEIDDPELLWEIVDERRQLPGFG